MRPHFVTFNAPKANIFKKSSTFAPANLKTIQFMANTGSLTPTSNQIIVTLESDAIIADIKKALRMIRGIASVRMASVKDDNTITPAVRRSINKARREMSNGETISCSTPEEMQRYFDSL